MSFLKSGNHDCTFGINLYNLISLRINCVLHLQTKNSSQVPIETKPASSVFDEELKSKIEENAMLHKKVNGFTTSTSLQRRISFATLYSLVNGGPLYDVVGMRVWICLHGALLRLDCPHSG